MAANYLVRPFVVRLLCSYFIDINGSNFLDLNVNKVFCWVVALPADFLLASTMENPFEQNQFELFLFSSYYTLVTIEILSSFENDSIM